MKQKFGGFSLIELLTVTVIVGILVGVAITNVLTTIRKQNIVKERDMILDSLKTAQTNSIAAKNAQKYGILFNINQIEELENELSVKQIKLKEGVELSSSCRAVNFDKLTGKTDLVDDCEVVVQLSGYKCGIMITKQGILNKTNLEKI